MGTRACLGLGPMAAGIESVRLRDLDSRLRHGNFEFRVSGFRV